MYADIKEFHKSTCRELEAVKNRVRNLIGRKHWTDGRYKEIVLSNVIKRFLPKQYAIGSGFIVKKEDFSNRLLISNQIDLIIYDTGMPLLFSEGDFIITTSPSVRGIIEVKTKLRTSDFDGVFNKANNAGKFIYEGKGVISDYFYNGVFSFEGPQTYCNEEFRSKFHTAIENLDRDATGHFWVNHICFNRDLLLRCAPGRAEYVLYKLENLAFSYFISNLLYYITDNGLEIEKDKCIWFPESKIGREIWSIG